MTERKLEDRLLAHLENPQKSHILTCIGISALGWAFGIANGTLTTIAHNNVTSAQITAHANYPAALNKCTRRITEREISDNLTLITEKLVKGQSVQPQDVGLTKTFVEVIEKHCAKSVAEPIRTTIAVEATDYKYKNALMPIAMGMAGLGLVYAAILGMRMMSLSSRTGKPEEPKP